MFDIVAKPNKFPSITIGITKQKGKITIINIFKDLLRSNSPTLDILVLKL